jgi:hypothetical protein
MFVKITANKMFFSKTNKKTQHKHKPTSLVSHIVRPQQSLIDQYRQEVIPAIDSLLEVRGAVGTQRGELSAWEIKFGVKYIKIKVVT